MWNVYQYIKDFGNNKIKYNEFINIYNSQKVLIDYIDDCYSDVINHNLIEQYKKDGGIVFPYQNYKNINDFIVNSKDSNSLINICKALTLAIDKIYKSVY